MTNIHWLWVAVQICGGRAALAKLCGVGESCLTKWLNGERDISLENAKKIEKATGWKVTRDRLVSNRDKAYIAELKVEVEILKAAQPPLTFIQEVQLGLTVEEALGPRKGTRTDLSPRENFPEVAVNLDNILNKKLKLQGRTEEIVAELAGFGNYKTYQQAKKVVKNGIPELVAAVYQEVSIYRAFQISKYPREEQLDLLKQESESSSKTKALGEAKSEKGANKWKNIHNPTFQSEKKSTEEDRSQNESIAAWALLSFNGTLFKNNKPKKMEEEQNQRYEEEHILQKTFNN